MPFLDFHLTTECGKPAYRLFLRALAEAGFEAL